MTDDPKTPWTALDKFVRDYVEGYEMRDAEDEAGNTTDYWPTELERTLIDDAIQGLLGDDEFVDLLCAAQEYTRACRRAEGLCETCGAGDGNHWLTRCRAAAVQPTDGDNHG